MKNKLKISAGLLAGTLPIVSVVSCSTLNDQLNVDQSNYVDFVMKNKVTDLTIDSLTDGDINIYHTQAIFPWQYMYHHAIMSKARTIIYRIKNSDIWDFESRFSKKEFEDFKKNQETVLPPLQTQDPIQWVQGMKKGTVEDIDWKGKYIEKADIDRFVSRTIKVIKSNPKKKINIYLNFDHAHYTTRLGMRIPQGLMGMTQLEIFTKFKNVRVHLVPDGEGTTDFWFNNAPDMTKEIANFAFDHLGKVFIYSSNPEDNKKKFPNIKQEKKDIVFNKTNIAEIKDLEFKERCNHMVGGKLERYHRIFGEVPAITGFNFKHTLDLVNQVKKARPNKPSLLFLGSYVDDKYNEQPFLEDLINRFGKTYNLFYKGHPGHNDITEKVIRITNHGETNPVKQRITVLESYIPSEVITIDNVKSGMFFDKFVSAEETGAIKGSLFTNGHNTEKDFLGYYDFLDKAGHYLSDITPANVWNDGTRGDKWWLK